MWGSYFALGFASLFNALSAINGHNPANPNRREFPEFGTCLSVTSNVVLLYAISLNVSPSGELSWRISPNEGSAPAAGIGTSVQTKSKYGFVVVSHGARTDFNRLGVRFLYPLNNLPLSMLNTTYSMGLEKKSSASTGAVSNSEVNTIRKVLNSVYSFVQSGRVSPSCREAGSYSISPLILYSNWIACAVVAKRAAISIVVSFLVIALIYCGIFLDVASIKPQSQT